MDYTQSKFTESMPISANYARHALPKLCERSFAMQEEEKGKNGRGGEKKKGEKKKKKKARLEKYPAIYAFNYAAAILRRINIACAS